MKILIVDDQVELLDMIDDELSFFGWDILKAKNGEETISIFKKHFESIDIVLMDYIMPVMDGIMVLPKLLQIDPFATIVMMSGHGSINLATEFMRLGGAGFIEKPITNFEILKLRIEESVKTISKKRELFETRAEVLSFKKSNCLISGFFENFAHVSRTPLHQLSSYIELAQKKLETNPEKASSYLIKSLIGAEKLEQLLTLASDFTMIQMDTFNYDFQSYLLSSMFRSSVMLIQAFADERNIQIKICGFDENIKIQCDENKIVTVFRNLLENSVKFSSEESNVNISIQCLETDVEIKVSDQGVGIPKDELEAIFNPFYQSSITDNGAGSTGMGLAIARGILFGHGGTIRAENNLDEIGATFTINLPIKQT